MKTSIRASPEGPAGMLACTLGFRSAGHYSQLLISTDSNALGTLTHSPPPPINPPTSKSFRQVLRGVRGNPRWRRMETCVHLCRLIHRNIRHVLGPRREVPCLILVKLLQTRYVEECIKRRPEVSIVAAV